MSYRIVYAWEKEKRLTPKKIMPSKAILAVSALLAVVVLRLMFPQAVGFLHELLYPLGDAYTAEAFSLMVEQLKQGIPVDEAVMTFCRDIIVNAR